MTRRLRIVLADDHEVVRKGMVALLEARREWTIVGEAANGRSAVALVAEHAPDVVVMDVGMPEMNGFEATRQILKLRPATEVLILTLHDGEEVVRQVIATGARGYVLKADAGDELVRAVASLGRHRPYFTSALARRVFDEAHAPRKRGRPPNTGLTEREREVLQLVAEGKKTGEIAMSLNLSPKTVETHRARLVRKTGVNSVAGLVHYALREKIIVPEATLPAKQPRARREASSPAPAPSPAASGGSRPGRKRA